MIQILIFVITLYQSMEREKNEIIQITKNWIEKLIIGMNLCPFAKEPYQKNAVRIIVSEAFSLTEGISFFEREIRYIAKHDKIETSLLVFPHFSDITVFNKFIQQCEALLVLKKWYKEYQITFFHPCAHIENFPINSPHHLVIQSPYPVLHILRVASVESLGAKVKEDVHIVNDQKLSQMSNKEVEKLWQDIKNDIQ